ncbi:MAG: farnesyl-diphosphate farnesyltransferase [Chthoniobacter sp.]|jgi:farnesyl-diphosphate farnesyltransferase|nr:farnesyl-diphosphate farnesyltransferase [Chthoniobacter sp.]
MSTGDLGGPLLASVSRSFYLTIRVLPPPLRAPIGLAYLLARASDTIADSAEASTAVRLAHLQAFGEMISTATTAGMADLQREIRPVHAGERELIAKLDRCLEWLAALAESDRREIATVMPKIIRGQTLDLQRFPGGNGIVALPSAVDLEEYTYLVAGCVGEFWTRICLLHIPRYAALEVTELSRLGINYGKGLQLVNILRDLPADLRDGRCYLPGDELRQAGTAPERLLAEPASARPVFERWLEQAKLYLDDGFRYLAALRPARLRIGCFLPWYLGRQTLRMLQAHSPLEAGERIKVPRATVRKALLLAVPVAFSNAALRLLR